MMVELVLHAFEPVNEDRESARSLSTPLICDAEKINLKLGRNEN